MVSSKLKAAVLGLDARGKGLLEAASKSGYFKIEAVGDIDSQVVEKTAAEYECRGYDDYRQLVMQNELDCLLVAAGIHSCEEHIRGAIKKNFNVLKLAPLARNFEEGQQLASLSEEAGVKFAVGNLKRFSKSFTALHEFLQDDGIEQVFLVSGMCMAGNKEQPGWQNDWKLSGGGVLLRNCYEIIDQMVWNFGIPEQVYCLNTNTASDRQQRQYLTEDTVLAVMKFGKDLIGNVMGSKAFGPQEESLKIYSKKKILTVSDSAFVVSDRIGRIEEERSYEEDERSCMERLLENFALSIGVSDKNRLRSSAKENLAVMAVIESAYLSWRTGMPEEPGKIFGSDIGVSTERDELSRAEG